MRTPRPSTITLALTLGAMLAIGLLVACQPAQSPTPSSGPAPETKPVTTQVFVIFEGPWALVPDPEDASKVLALSPKTDEHRPLGVVPANETLEAGVYELQVPPHTSVTASTFDKDIFRTAIDPQKVRQALKTRLNRYAIRLPKPEAYLAETRYPSVVSNPYPHDLSAKKDYATAISLRYSVNSLSGFSLAGTKDAGGAYERLLQLDTPIVRFEVDPAHEFKPDACDTHPRKAFRELTRLLGLTLYVDFPTKDSDDCRKNDPQLKRTEAQLIQSSPVAQGTRSLWRIAFKRAGLMDGVVEAYFDSNGRGLVDNLAAAFFFFHTATCRTPILVDNGLGNGP